MFFVKAVCLFRQLFYFCSMKYILIIFSVLLSFYVAFGLFVYFFQKVFIFYPHKGYSLPPHDMNISEVEFKNQDGDTLYGWWMHDDSDSAKYTVLFCHGNAGNIYKSERRMRFFSECGFNVLAFDYRGYGNSSGYIQNEDDIYEDGEAALKFLNQELKINSDSIILWGWSLGGAVATDIAAKYKCKALVLESTFFSMLRMAKRVFWFLPYKWLLKFHFRTDLKINKIKYPVLFVHSPDDLVVPYQQGVRLYDSFQGEKKFITINGSHRDGILESKDYFINEAKPFLFHN